MATESANYLRGRFKNQLVMECDGVRVTFDTTTEISKEWFYPRYIDGQLHEPALTRRLLRTLDRDSVFYDVGANVGYFTVFAAAVCTDGEVHSFEIDSKFIDAIAASLDRNGTSAALTRKAVSNGSGETVSYSDRLVPSIADDQGETKSVETVTLDDYRHSNPTPNVMKIDVEGFEHDVLQGARETLSHPDMETLFLEVHPELLKQYGSDKHDVFSIIDDCGFEWARIDDHRGSGSSALRDATPDEITSNTMLVCQR